MFIFCLRVLKESLFELRMNPDIENYNETKIKIEYLTKFYRNCVPNELFAWGIHSAVLEGGLRKLETCMREFVNRKDKSYGFSALHLAVIKNDMEMLEYLLSRPDVEVNTRCTKGRTPVYLATALGWIESVKKLIQAGSNINITDNGKLSPLHMSVHHADICYVLIQHGAIIDAVDDRDRTPLDYAAENNCVEAIYVLLYYNADVNVLNIIGCTPFMTALYYESSEAQEALLEYVEDFNIVMFDGTSFDCVLSLALNARSPCIKDIIERGANVNYGDDVRFSENESALRMCLLHPVDLSVFKMIWERLRFRKSKCTMDFWHIFECIDIAPSIFQIIIESDNFDVFFDYFNADNHYSDFICTYGRQKLNYDQLAAFTCRLFQYSYRVNNYDVYEVFFHYGYCELFRLLLYMQITSIGWYPRMAICTLMSDVYFNLGELDANEVRRFHREDLLQLFEYTICPRLVDKVTLQYKEDETMSTILARLPRVPSLIELARNAARIQIWESFKLTATCQFYTRVDHFEIPTLYKEILTFKKKLYTVK